MRPVEEHLAACLGVAAPPAATRLPLLDALDLVLLEDVRSPLDLPGFDNSAMDGYAVRAADVADAAPGAPVSLPVVADVPAGAAPPDPAPPGAAVRIMTGAPMPDGADTVVPVEWTDGGTAQVAITRPSEAARFVRRLGEDVRAGETVLRSGTRLTPRDVALLAAVGHDRVLVRPRPRVAVLSTGTELVPPGTALQPGRIHDANGYGLAAAAAELGAAVVPMGIVGDDADAVRSAVHDAAARADVVLTSGGISAGAYDTVKEVLRALGTVDFVKVAMQPGMPQGVGTIEGPGGAAVPIFTLPGNPVSSMVSFEVFVRPALRTMLGEETTQRPRVLATAATGWSSPAGKRQFVRGRLGTDGGRPTVRPVGGPGSHLVAHLAEATCLAVVPEEVTEVRPGDPVECLLLERGRR